MTDTTTPTREPKFIDDLSLADNGSWYTILGVGGELHEWVEGYEKALAEIGISAPSQWFRTSGAAINGYAAQRRGAPIVEADRFPDDMTVLLFPLGDLTGNLSALPIFKIQWHDRWFDDVIANMRGER